MSTWWYLSKWKLCFSNFISESVLQKHSALVLVSMVPAKFGNLFAPNKFGHQLDSSSSGIDSQSLWDVQQLKSYSISFLKDALPFRQELQPNCK